MTSSSSVMVNLCMTSEGQGPLAGDSKPPIDRSEAPRRITAENVEQVRKEKEAIYSRLMDEMEASVLKQGQYFIKLGDKGVVDPDSKETFDTRALLLIRPAVGEGGSKLFIVVTREGAKGLKFKLMPEEKQRGLKGMMGAKIPAGPDEYREGLMMDQEKVKRLSSLL